MQYLKPIALFSLVFLLFSFGCKSSPKNDVAQTDIWMQDPLPEPHDSAKVELRDFHYWMDDENTFCVVSIVDNLDFNWQKIWVRLELRDKEGQPVMIDGQPGIVVRTFSDAVPPRGATSFFCTLKLDRLSGKPDSCIVTGEGSVMVPAGPIILASNISNVKMFSGNVDPADTLAKESAWIVSFMLENPLALTAYNPCANLLIYGQDSLLYHSQVLAPNDPVSKTVGYSMTALGPTEKKMAGFNVAYEGLSKKLQEVRIKRVEILGFEGRDHHFDAEAPKK